MIDQHTPGPWHLCDSESEVGPRYVLYVTAREGASVFGEDVGYFENAEDAALCSAAPDLLEALEEMVEESINREVKARAAIAKARGQEA